jgi:DNA-binding NtrC family response regulator
LRARLIFATHQDLGKLVAEGKFRQDLFYRINVMRIDSPQLQDRPEDIPLIAGHFLRHYANVFQKPMDSIEPAAMEMLQTYAWPGNVRELENVMQRAIILAPGKVVRTEDLNIKSHEPEEDSSSFDQIVDIADYQPSGSFERQLREYKIRLAVAAVRENNGNKTMAARSLSISRAYLHRLLRLAEDDALVASDHLSASDPLFADHKMRETVTA